MSRERDTDTDLQRGFEPLRTAFAVLVLLLGFAASARADGGMTASTLRAAPAPQHEFNDPNPQPGDPA